MRIGPWIIMRWETFREVEDLVDDAKADMRLLETKNNELGGWIVTQADKQKRAEKAIAELKKENNEQVAKLISYDRRLGEMATLVSTQTALIKRPNETVIEALGTMIEFCKHYVRECPDRDDDNVIMSLHGHEVPGHRRKENGLRESIKITIGSMRRLVTLANIFDETVKAVPAEPAVETPKVRTRRKRPADA